MFEVEMLMDRKSASKGRGSGVNMSCRMVSRTWFSVLDVRWLRHACIWIGEGNQAIPALPTLGEAENIKELDESPSKLPILFPRDANAT
jgi:hypothetical protein